MLAGLQGFAAGVFVVLGVVVVVVLAGLAAVLRGGSVLRIADLPLRGLPLVVVAASLQIVVALFLARDTEWLAPAAVLASNCLVGGCLLLNRRLPGVALAFLGLALNASVTLLNGGMPVSRGAAEVAHLQPEAARFDAEHTLMTDETVLKPLGDVIPIPAAHLVISGGDLLLAAGLALFVYRGARPSTRPRAVRFSDVSVAMGGGEK